MSKLVNVAVAVYIVITFVITLYLNKLLGTDAIQYQRSFSLWILAILPAIIGWIYHSDSKEKQNG